MNCPVDGTVLEAHTLHGVQVEECPQCRGIWFDQGELRDAKDQAEPDVAWLDFDLWSDPDAFAAEWSQRACPKCAQNLAVVSYGNTGVVVEYCTEGHGLWLDKGEFSAIVQALEDEVNTKEVPDYLAASLEEASEIVAGDEGFVSGWKDFSSVMRMLQYRVLVENPKLAELISALQATSPLR